MILQTEDICYKVWRRRNGMLYDVECPCPGWTTECEGVQNGVVKRMVSNGGVKLRCGVECHHVILNVLWYG